MKSTVLALVCLTLLVAAIVVGLAALGAPRWTLIVVWFVVVGGHQLYCRVLVPRGARRRLLKAVDPTAGPPPGVAPTESVVLGQLDAASDGQDWDALRALLSDDFAFVVGKRRLGARVYIRILKNTDRQLPGESTTDEVVAHPDEPDVLWVRATVHGQPRFGPGFLMTGWTRVRVTPDGLRVREIADAGVLSVA